MVQRLPATCTTVARAVAAGAKPTAADHEPAAPGGRQQRGPGQPPPVLPAGAWRAVASAQPTPACSPQRRHAGFDLVWPAAAPDRGCPRDGQDRGGVGFLHPQPPRSMLAIATIARHPGSWAALVKGARQALLRPWRCGRPGPLRWTPRALAACGGVRPCVGEIACTSQQDMALGAGSGQEYPPVTLRHATRGAARWARHSSRMRTFVEPPRRRDDQHRLRDAPGLDHGGAPIGAKGLGIPARASQYLLDPLRRRVAVDFGDLPAMVPRYRAAHATEIRPGTPPDVAPRTRGASPIVPPRSATASRGAPYRGARLLGMGSAPAAAPWCRPPARVENHDNTRSTTVVLSTTARFHSN